MKIELTKDEAMFVERAIQKIRLHGNKLRLMQSDVLHHLRGEASHRCSKCNKLYRAWQMVNHEYHDGNDWYCRTCWENLEDKMIEMQMKMSNEKLDFLK